MRQSYRRIPVYTADVSGVCAALFELGGMTVMHDPSGCNSTYNTHDEIRWYDQDSLIFISGLSEMDAIMGNDEKLIHDTVKAARELHPAFIALANSPIPYMNGTDFPAIADIVQQETGIPSFAVATNGMHDYVCGVGRALAKIAELFTDPDAVCNNPRTVNLLGVTPLDFGPLSHVSRMKEVLEAYGWTVLSVWAMGDTRDTLKRAGEAAVNLVVSLSGLMAAEVLFEKFGTPYVIGTPIGGFTARLSAAMERAVKTKKSETAYRVCDRETSVPAYSGGEVTVIGEPVLSESLAAAIRLKVENPVRVLNPLEQGSAFLLPGDRTALGEEEMEAQLKGAQIIVADPLYRSICPQNAKFYALPHIAFSGRIFLKELPVFADLL